LAESQSDYAQAQVMLERCLELRRGLGNPTDIAATLSTLSITRLLNGDGDIARAGEEESLGLFRAQGNRVGEAIVLLHLGQIGVWSGDDAQARAHLEASLALACQIGHRETEAESELVIGQLEFEDGALGRARARFVRSLTVSQGAADKRGEANALRWLAKVDLGDGACAEVGIRLHAALRAFRAFEMREELLSCLEDCAVLAFLNGRNGLAVQIAAASAASRERLSLLRPPRDEMRWQRHVAALREAMDEQPFQAAWSEGGKTGIDEAIALARQAFEGLS